MKTISLTIEDATWEELQRQARAQGKGVGDWLSGAAARLAASPAATPSHEERRRFLGQFWERIDACNVEVGERPSRARTDDHRRFHRH